MSKTVQNAILGRWVDRRKLTPRDRPYYFEINDALRIHLGYRRRARSAGGDARGEWVVRRYVGDNKYKMKSIGLADDQIDGNPPTGTELSFSSALQLANDVAPSLLLTASVDETEVPAAPKRVADVVRAYILEREAQAAEVGLASGAAKDARYRLEKYVLLDREKIRDKVSSGSDEVRWRRGILADEEIDQFLSLLAKTPLSDLTVEKLKDWRRTFPQGVFANDKVQLEASTIARTVNDLKAALNRAPELFVGATSTGFADVVRHGLKAGRRKTSTVHRGDQILSDESLRLVLRAAGEVDAEGNWGGDLQRLVLVLSATGARFSQVVRIRVGDLQLEQSRVMVPVSRKGSDTKARETTRVRVGPDVVEALRPQCSGRRSSETLLLRPRWKQVAPTKWEIVSRDAWRNPSELSRPWAEIRKRAGLSSDIVPYSLRHSSIVRGLRVGQPVRLVAALHDTSSTMIERHYSAYIADALEELSALAVVPLLPDALP